jgi:hypothetical protein
MPQKYPDAQKLIIVQSQPSPGSLRGHGLTSG